MNSAQLKVLEDAARAVIHELGITRDELLESVQPELLARNILRRHFPRWIRDERMLVYGLALWGLIDWLESLVDDARDALVMQDKNAQDHHA
jgi:hypothetical protein